MARALSSRSFDDGVDAGRLVSAAPAAALAGQVASYADYQERTGSFTARRELAATGGVLIVNLGAPLEIEGEDGAVLRLRAGEGFIGGLSETTALSRSTGEQQGVHVFAPVEVLARIAGCPPAELTNRVVSLDAAVGSAARTLGQRLGEVLTAEDRFDVLDAFIAARLARAAAPDTRIATAAAMLRRNPAAGIERVADAVNTDRRTLARRFGETMGLAPRRYVRLARFEAFAASLARAPEASLADLALAAGYYDQPHLNRDVRTLAAATPVDLRRRVLPVAGGYREG